LLLLLPRQLPLLPLLLMLSKTLALPVPLLLLPPLLPQLLMSLPLQTQLLLLLLASNPVYAIRKKATVRWLFYVCTILKSSG
jgi:hypothetical protein